MSYNISTWKTIKLENLTIPLKSLYEIERKDWLPEQPKIIDSETNAVRIDGGCDQHIFGILTDEILTVTKLVITGEGSGSFMTEVFNNAFKQSKGELEAILIWEGGDSITKLTIKDGVIDETAYEL